MFTHNGFLIIYYILYTKMAAEVSVYRVDHVMNNNVQELLEIHTGLHSL